MQLGKDKVSAYDESTMKTLVSALRRMFVHDDFTNWLFIPGTILWHTRSWSSSLKELEAVVRNMAVVIKGGHAKAPWATTDKLYFSDADNVPKGMRPENALLGEILGDYSMRKSSIQTIDG